jgi:hypothetical protein
MDGEYVRNELLTSQWYGIAPGSISYTGGNVGIGTTVPSANLHVTGNVFATTIGTTNPISFRNRVINGDFNIDHRNSGAAITPAATVNAIDRWKVNINGTGRCQVGENLGAIAPPVGFTSYYGMKVTTTTSVAAGNYYFLSQCIEGMNTIDWAFGTASAKPITLGFWVYSSLTGTIGGFFRNAGASGISRSYPFTFTVTAASTWEYETITIPGDVTGTWPKTEVDGIEFGISLWNGSTFQAAPGAWVAGNYTGPTGAAANFAGTLNSIFYITGVQVESGTVATPWERRHYSVELDMCQRYYETTIARLGGYNTTGGGLRGSVYFNTKKRPAATPSFTVLSTLENINIGALTIDNSNFDQRSARVLASVTTTGDAYGQWKVAVDCEF